MYNWRSSEKRMVRERNGRKMKIVLAPDSYKGSMHAMDVAKAMAEGVHRVVPDAETVLIPVSDGGDGTLETLVANTDGRVESLEVTGPLGEPLIAEWGALGDGHTAVVETARTSGLALVPIERQDPRIATTYGLGQAMRAALDAGFRRFIVAIGGSATNDAGAGMAQSLGARLLDKDGIELPQGGSALGNLEHIDISTMDPRVREATFLVACDVSNPLTGPKGASVVYGPQKGATPEMIQELDEALGNFASVVKRDLDLDVDDVAGSGAAGGLGAGLIAFADGDLKLGVDIVLSALNFDSRLRDADLVITGEGCLDYQTTFNKAPVGVAAMAKARGISVIAVSGSHGEGFQEVHDHGIDAAVPIVCEPMTLEQSTERGVELVAAATEQALRMMATGARVFENHPRS